MIKARNRKFHFPLKMLKTLGAGIVPVAILFFGGCSTGPDEGSETSYLSSSSTSGGSTSSTTSGSTSGSSSSGSSTSGSSGSSSTGGSAFSCPSGMAIVGVSVSGPTCAYIGSVLISGISTVSQPTPNAANSIAIASCGSNATAIACGCQSAGAGLWLVGNYSAGACQCAGDPSGIRADAVCIPTPPAAEPPATGCAAGSVAVGFGATGQVVCGSIADLINSQIAYSSQFGPNSANNIAIAKCNANAVALTCDCQADQPLWVKEIYGAGAGSGCQCAGLNTTNVRADVGCLLAPPISADATTGGTECASGEVVVAIDPVTGLVCRNLGSLMNQNEHSVTQSGSNIQSGIALAACDAGEINLSSTCEGTSAQPLFLAGSSSQGSQCGVVGTSVYSTGACLAR